MEYNKIFNEQPDLDEGQKWKMPQCLKCKHNQGRTCLYFNKDRTQVEVDIFNCPKFEPKETDKEKAMRMMKL